MSNQQPSLLEKVIFPDCEWPTKEEVDHYTEQADRYNTGKPELSYILDAPLAMEGLANRFSLGAKKYSRDNWKKGLPDVQVIDSLLRHLKAYQNGEALDEDGGNHVDAIVWNAVVLSEQYHKRRQAIES
jgi:hypothetical protein